jgi:hypothetical protein
MEVGLNGLVTLLKETFYEISSGRRFKGWIKKSKDDKIETGVLYET